MKCCLWYIDALMATFEVWVGYRNMCHDWLNASASKCMSSTVTGRRPLWVCSGVMAICCPMAFQDSVCCCASCNNLHVSHFCSWCVRHGANLASLLKAPAKTLNTGPFRKRIGLKST